MKGSTIYENEKVLFGICVAEVLLGGGTFCFFLICPQWILAIFAVFLACTLGNFILGFRRIRRQVNRTMELVDDTIEQLILHHECRYFEENEDNLLGKFQSQIVRLYQILSSYEEHEKRQKEQLEESISDLVHQINTPIANLQLYSSLLEQEEITCEERKVFSKNIRDQADKLEWLGENFSKISRLEHGMICLRPSIGKLLPVVLAAVDEVALKAKGREQEIRLLGDQCLEAWFDPKWTEEVFFNLLDNAVKYSNPKSVIDIRIEDYEMHIRVSVITRGQLPGKDEIPKLFQRFYRGKNAGRAEGVGLGLYLVREIMRNQKGYVKVSTDKKEEVTFSVSFRKNAEETGTAVQGNSSLQRAHPL